MRTIALLCLGLTLTGCGQRYPGGFVGGEGSLIGRIEDAQRPGERQAAQKAADDAKCREFGFKPGTEAYGNCRLQIEQTRVTKAATDAADRASTQARQRNEGGIAPAPLSGDKGLSLLCKDAISRGDSGGTFVHC